jgi:phosphate-selective porin
MIKSSLHVFRLLAVLFLILPVMPLRADPAASTIEERLARLESALARIESRLDHTVSADELAPVVKEYGDLSHALGWDGKSPLTAVKPAGKEKSLTFGGFIQANYMSGNAPDSRVSGSFDTFLLRRARLSVAGAFSENVSFKIESDFGNNSLAAKTGVSGQATDSYVSWTQYPGASVRLGQFKTPFGYEQLTSDTTLYPIERSLSNDLLTLGRQIGTMVYGDVADKRVSYSLAVFNGTGTNTGSNDNEKFLKVGRVAVVLLDTKAGAQPVKVSAGVDYFSTEDKGTFTGRREGSGLDAQLVYGPTEFQAEWLQNQKHPATGLATTAQGWSLLGAYNVTPKWQGLVRYDSFESNTALANATTDEWTFGVSYLLRGNDLKLSLNYISSQQPAPLPRGDLFLTRVQVIF